MSSSARDWLVGRQFAAESRLRKPLTAGSLPAPDAAAQRAILAAHLAVWIEGEAIRLPTTHAIALTTSDIGILVADDVTGLR